MSFNSSDDDSQQRFALGFLFALIALVVSTVVGVVVYKRGIAHAHKAPAALKTPSSRRTVKRTRIMASSYWNDESLIRRAPPSA